MDLDEQLAINAEFDARPRRDSWLGFEVGFSGSYASEAETPHSAFELYLGPRVTIGGPGDPIRFFVGAGAAHLWGWLDLGVVDDWAQSFAGYAHAGFEVALSDYFSVGADMRALDFADLDYFDVDSHPGDQGYLQAAGAVIVHW